MLLSEIFFRTGLTLIISSATIFAYLVLHLRVNPALAEHAVITTSVGVSALMTAVGVIISAVAYIWGYPFILIP